mmetsp:Transcript_8838/g.18158  ORF Transcript_8838/g.18158 Transcript_8838/m.18158 type:complete len:200 (+) Transcript_8838:616-1215(+)
MVHSCQCFAQRRFGGHQQRGQTQWPHLHSHLKAATGVDQGMSEIATHRHLIIPGSQPVLLQAATKRSQDGTQRVPLLPLRSFPRQRQVTTQAPPAVSRFAPELEDPVVRSLILFCDRLQQLQRNAVKLAVDLRHLLRTKLSRQGIVLLLRGGLDIFGMQSLVELQCLLHCVVFCGVFDSFDSFDASANHQLHGLHSRFH